MVGTSQTLLNHFSKKKALLKHGERINSILQIEAEKRENNIKTSVIKLIDMCKNQ